MTAAAMTLADFLLARIAEDEEQARTPGLASVVAPNDLIAFCDPDTVTLVVSSHRVLAECEAKRRIVEWHKNWPVLVQQPPTFDGSDAEGFDYARGDLSSMTFRMSQRIAWATEQQYRDTFGTEPPTGPVLRLLALPYADHPDYRDEWRP